MGLKSSNICSIVTGNRMKNSGKKKIKIKGSDKQGERKWVLLQKVPFPRYFILWLYKRLFILIHWQCFVKFAFYLTLVQSFCILRVSQSQTMRKLYSEILDWSMFQVATLMILIFHLNSQPIKGSHKLPSMADLLSYCSSWTLTKNQKQINKQKPCKNPITKTNPPKNPNQTKEST